jgi:hypothetical protein
MKFGTTTNLIFSFRSITTQLPSLYRDKRDAGPSLGHSLTFASLMYVSLSTPFLHHLTWSSHQPIARTTSQNLRHLKPPRNTLCQPFSSAADATSYDETLYSVLQAIQGLDIKFIDNCHGIFPMPYQTRHTVATPPSVQNHNAERDTRRSQDEDPDEEEKRTIFLVSAVSNTWSRAERRSRKVDMVVDDPPKAVQLGAWSSPIVAPSLVCYIQWTRDRSGLAGTTKKFILECSWVKGSDRAIFESFAGHVGRKVEVVLLGK